MGQTVSTTRQGCDAIRPSFPSLHWPVESCDYAIYYLWDSWRFTLLWTLILYGIFHLSAAGVALFVQVGKHRSTWKYLWAVPIVYAFTAALEALVAGSVVGVLVGAIYFNGRFHMSTWIPFIWGWINVLMLIVSSFTIQGGL